jgi:hypothetical protein
MNSIFEDLLKLHFTILAIYHLHPLHMLKNHALSSVDRSLCMGLCQLNDDFRDKNF